MRSTVTKRTWAANVSEARDDFQNQPKSFVAFRALNER